MLGCLTAQSDQPHMPLHPGLLRCCTVRYYCSSRGQLDRTPWTLKLKSLQDGPFDEKFGEYEWLHKATPSLSTIPPQPSLPRPQSPNPPVVLHLLIRFLRPTLLAPCKRKVCWLAEKDGYVEEEVFPLVGSWHF